MKAMTLQLELTTPGFLGGARPERDCGWRAASVRGQLRWWLRAVAGGGFQGDLEEVRRVEEAVFGSTGRSSTLTLAITGGNDRLEARHPMRWGRALGTETLAETWGIDPRQPDYAQTFKRLNLPFAVNPVGYLGGQGVIGYKKGEGQFLARPCLQEGTEATLTVRWRPGRKLPQEHRELFDHALWAWLHLGGLGARSRRGFGSLAVADGTNGTGFFEPPATLDELVTRLRSLLGLGKESTAVAEWSHLSSATRICLPPGAFSSWEEAMVHAGAWLMAFRRRYGLADEPSEKRDYHWAKAASDHITPRGVPDRAGFGLPLPFGKYPNEIVSWGPEGQDRRRASPLLLHIGRVGEGFVPVFTHLPARLVPKGDKSGVVRFQGLSRPEGPPTREQLGIVTAFLDDLVAKDKLRSLTP